MLRVLPDHLPLVWLATGETCLTYTTPLLMSWGTFRWLCIGGRLDKGTSAPHGSKPRAIHVEKMTDRQTASMRIARKF